MQKRMLKLATIIAILTCGTVAASAQAPSNSGPVSQQSPTIQGHDQVIQGVEPLQDTPGPASQQSPMTQEHEQVIRGVEPLQDEDDANKTSRPASKQ
jgi:hypothetical protein